jgi:hypothetical protein
MGIVCFLKPIKFFGKPFGMMRNFGGRFAPVFCIAGLDFIKNLAGTSFCVFALVIRAVATLWVSLTLGGKGFWNGALLFWTVLLEDPGFRWSPILTRGLKPGLAGISARRAKQQCHGQPRVQCSRQV